MACASEVSTRCGTARGSTTAQTQFTDRTVSQRGVWLHDRRSHRTTWPCTWWRRCPCHFRSTLPVSRAHRVAQGCTGYKVRVVRYKTRRGRAGHASAGTRRRQVALSLSAALAAAWGASAVVRYLVDRAWHRCQQAHAFAGPIEVLDHTTFGVDFESTCQSSWEGRSASRQRPRQWQRLAAVAAAAAATTAEGAEKDDWAGAAGAAACKADGTGRCVLAKAKAVLGATDAAKLTDGAAACKADVAGGADGAGG